ncbi:fimbrillin family protein [Parabacteroides distasonis]|nr:fimbrillin family protein [Parabacteroides distasonis]
MDAHFPVASDTVIDFYAYYPYQASLSNSEASYELKDQIDIMYATPILNKGKMDVETDTNGSTATVALTFNHQLSAITIVIKKADDIKEPLILQKVELVNYPSSIRMNIRTGRLTASNTKADYPIPLSAPITITPAEATVSTNYLLWPGEAPTFRFSISDHTYEVHPSQAFIAGKKQKYTFTIQAEDINVGASINPWTEGPEGSGEIGI